ncbi:MAG: class I SAM-dependent methyltransferase, partial [Saprospiraceae bacterium]|nr:class I SAM-dependent methyltransferase [Saprospiraceae bacterium]
GVLIRVCLKFAFRSQMAKLSTYSKGYVVIFALQIIMNMLQTAERVSDVDASDNYIYQRSLLAYHEAAKIVSGDILEIGTGSGYGIKIISPKADRYVTIDKFDNEQVQTMVKTYSNVSFTKMEVPPLNGIPDNSFDFVITFQVIEHIEDDKAFVSEIHRVLKKGGKLIVSTPNIKMTLTRNPWHIREYTTGELDSLLKVKFPSVIKNGVYGNEKVFEYYEKNKKSVQRITRFDIFDLQHKAPRWMLQIPYDILNRLNRRRLLKDNTGLVSDFSLDDYSISEAKENCLDLYYIAEK